MAKKQKKKIAVIGAGPIGLEAAIAAIEHGYLVNVFERGEVGDAVRRWGHVRMFSPLGMNVSMRGLERLRHGGNRLPDPDALLTGTEYVAEYLMPLSYTLGEGVHTNVEVMAIGRCEIMKGELIGSAERMDSSFRLLLRRGSREWTEQADYVFDCTGTYSTPNHLGDGGMPAVGESASRSLITYGAPDVLGRLRWLFENRRVLVVGSGHSAATSIRDLASLRSHASETEIIWATRRSTSQPFQRIENDPLPQRDELVREANHLAESGDVDFRRDSTVLALEQTKEGLKVTLSNCVGTDAVYVDRVIAAVGFRPDLELTRELQTQICYATEGAFHLAAAMVGENGGDGSAATAGGAEKLLHPEPGYFSLGMKSYGRAPDFLIRTGREQIESVLNWVEKNAV
jgi:thioredoxin reductase